LVTIKDISKACGVSPSTVSKVLNGYTDISRDTVEQVFRTAEAMGYTPNAAARMLKTNRSNNIGVLFVDQMQSGLRHEYFSAMLNSVKDEAESRGYDITFISQNLGGRQMSYLDHCRYRKCDGVIIACVDFTDSAVLELVGSDIPVVTVDHVFDQRGAVLSDNVGGMEELVTYIHEQGHRSIAFIHGEMTSVTRSRLAGFFRACEKLGVSVPEEYVRPGRYHDPDTSDKATRELLALKKPPTCIIYPDDFSFIGGRNYLTAAGLSIPGDVSVAGYDGIYMSQVMRPALTTLQQDTDALGRRSAAMVIDAIENRRTYLPRQELIPGRLLPGGTVKRLA
jgi:LacI family transcriptional regulator